MDRVLRCIVGIEQANHVAGLRDEVSETRLAEFVWPDAGGVCHRSRHRADASIQLACGEHGDHRP